MKRHLHGPSVTLRYMLKSIGRIKVCAVRKQRFGIKYHTIYLLNVVIQAFVIDPVATCASYPVAWWQWAGCRLKGLVWWVVCCTCKRRRSLLGSPISWWTGQTFRRFLDTIRFKLKVILISCTGLPSPLSSLFRHRLAIERCFWQRTNVWRLIFAYWEILCVIISKL